ncbi:MAG: hypothetical protein OSA93_06240 [Akkermansiaceae bacterium]|jgi:hypothetical protein|nr:hypothetical protein [Akkermansiaceae bacterium]
MILQNDHRSFFLAPPLGFFAKARPESGVGGVYFPADENDKAYLWEYLLKNKKRTFSSPTNQNAPYFSMPNGISQKAPRCSDAR